MHVPVLAVTAIDWLDVRGGGTYVDCTAGAGGHAVLIAKGVGPRGHVLALDRDEVAVRMAQDRLRPYPWARVVHRNYAELDAILADEHMTQVDGVLIDAGMSSMQLDDPTRGFTFQAEGPLDMRMDRSQGETARELLHRISEDELARLLREFGEVRAPRRIAKAICRSRDRGALETTGDLIQAVLEGNAGKTGAGAPPPPRKAPQSGPRADAVRQIFQAIRVAVNDELGALERAIRAAVDALNPHGRLVVITFQSGEDRVWKKVMNDLARDRKELYPDGRVKRLVPKQMNVLTKRAVYASSEEIAANPRAHSARLRAAERVAEDAAA